MPEATLLPYGCWPTLCVQIISSFALLTATYGAHSGGLQRGVSTIFSPLQEGADRALKPAREPSYEASEIYGIIPNDVRKPYDVRDVIARIVDGSELDEFKALYGTTLICGFAHIFGYPVGILANNGILFSESALKRSPDFASRHRSMMCRPTPRSSRRRWRDWRR